MRCKKAREFYFKNRDGILSEADKMRLQDHLSSCADCSKFAEDMDRSLGLLSHLEELSPSEGFEWNVKRRILQEKTRLIRSRETENRGLSFVFKFAGATAAAAAVVLLSVFFMFKTPEQGARVASGKVKEATSYERTYSSTAYSRRATPVAATGYPRARMVSSSVRNYPAGYAQTRALPFETTTLSYSDSLLWENALLRKRVNDLEKQVIYLHQVIRNMQMKR